MHSRHRNVLLVAAAAIIFGVFNVPSLGFAAAADYGVLSFSDEFDSAPLSIGMPAENPSAKWVPGWISWNTRHLSGNSDDAWKQADDEHGWTNTWQNSGRSIGDALRSNAGFVAAHGNGPYNHEVSNGTLKMRAFRVPSALRNTDFGGFAFTGGMISTEDKFSFKNGRIEIRIRFPRIQQGAHFAFWTLSQDNKRWEANYGPEIDMLEVLSRDPAKGFERPNHWHQNIIGIPTKQGQTGYPWAFYVDVPDFDTAWHTVALERGTDNKIRFYIDDVLRREENVAGKSQYTDEKHFILGSWEVGGNWPGEVVSTDPNWHVEAEIDYVRVYAPGAAPTPTTACTPLFPSGAASASGFAASWNLFSSAKELLLTPACNGANIALTVGNMSTKETPYVYKLGYYWSGTEWKSYSLSGANASGDWFRGTAQASIPRQAGNSNFFLGYTCQLIDNAWKCGCSDTACTSPKWQLQGVK